MFRQSNPFLMDLMPDLARDIERDLHASLDVNASINEAPTEVTPVQAAALGTAAVLARNPVVSRRFFGGVREGGSIASLDPSSSDHLRRITHKETVA